MLWSWLIVTAPSGIAGMSTDASAALIALSGAILLAVGGVIAAIVANRNKARSEHGEVVNWLNWVATQQQTLTHQQWSHGQQIAWIQNQLPPGGLTQWIEATQRFGESLESLASSLDALSKRVDEHDETLRTLRGL